MTLLWFAVQSAGFALWLKQLKTKNINALDVLWTFATTSFIVTALFHESVNDNTKLRFVTATMILIWGIRLSVHLIWNRVINHPEDQRYAELRFKWGKNSARNMFLMIQLQIVLAFILALPFFFLAQNSYKPSITAYTLSFVLYAMALAGELISDRQLKHFRSEPSNKGQLCTLGLWKYSRHPNYFFEWLHWVSYVPLYIGSANGWLILLPASIMYLLLTRITGIPPVEKRMRQSRQILYKKYAQTTNSFFPGPRRDA